jgi:hypothetical protein
MGTHILAISDRKISTWGFSADHVAQKVGGIHRNWIAMASGDDISPSTLMLDKVGTNLRKQPIKEWTLEEVSAAFTSSYQEYRNKTITEKFLAQYALTMESFLEKGRRLLGLSLFTNIWNEIYNCKIGCQFLVVGFDKEQTGHVFYVEGSGYLY